MRPGSGRPLRGDAPASSVHPLAFSRRGTRRALLAALAFAGLWAAQALDLQAADLWPAPGGLAVAQKFFARALTPALVSEARFVPPGTPPLLLNALDAALGSHSGGGGLLGFLASNAFWSGEAGDARRESLKNGEGSPRRRASRAVRMVLYLSVRALITFLRSIHELIWAVLFLAALGLSELAAVMAIALPYSGVLAKVFSEIIDEAPRDAARALRAAGASRAQAFLFGLVPGAIPDMLAYAFYRLECALRSSAVLGFFGFPTLGLYIRQSFNSTNYGEVWTYLYVLIALVMFFEAWSAAVRRRLVE